jgi:hypothetical protein
MFKKISLAIAALALSIGSGCVSAPNAANALTPDKAGCRKDALPGDYVACLQVLSQQRQLQGGGFAAGGPAPATANPAPPVDQGSAPPPGGGEPVMRSGLRGMFSSELLTSQQPASIALACDGRNGRFQMRYYNVPGRATVPRGSWVICAEPRRLVTIVVNGAAVPAIPPGSMVVLAGLLPAMCYTEAGYGNHSCRITDAEFDSYSLETVVSAGASAASGGPSLTAFWVGKWRPQAPYRSEVGAEAFVPHGDLPHQGSFTPNDRSFRR